METISNLYPLRNIFGITLSSKKQSFIDCQRALSPEKTLEKIKPNLNQAGITRITDVTGLDRINVPVTSSIRPNGKSVCTSAGKGLTLFQSMVSSAMEAIEFFHAETITNKTITGSYNQLKLYYEMIQLNELPLRKYSIFHSDLSVDWLNAWDIVANREVLVPFEMVSMNFQEFRQNKRLHLFQAGSNGLSSGNNLLEAMVTGIYELIERDAITICKLQETHGKPMKRIKHITIPYLTIKQLVEKLLNVDILPVIFDSTIDTRIPTFSVVLYDKRPNLFCPFAGYGTHLDPEIALIRAITEAIQGRAIYIAGARDDVFIQDDIRAKRNYDHYPDESAGIDFKWFEHKNMSDPFSFEADLETLIQHLNRLEINKILALDLSKPEFNISVVKMIIPGLEGYFSDMYSMGIRAKKIIQTMAVNFDTNHSFPIHFIASKGV